MARKRNIAVALQPSLLFGLANLAASRHGTNGDVVPRSSALIGSVFRSPSGDLNRQGSL